jgi:hypothetical protein
MKDANGDDLELFDYVKIAGDKNEYIWQITAELGNGTVTIKRGLDHLGITQSYRLVWVKTPSKKYWGETN